MYLMAVIMSIIASQNLAAARKVEFAKNAKTLKMSSIVVYISPQTIVDREIDRKVNVSRRNSWRERACVRAFDGRLQAANARTKRA